jgi:hypothetical protein
VWGAGQKIDAVIRARKAGRQKSYAGRWCLSTDEKKGTRLLPSPAFSFNRAQQQYAVSICTVGLIPYPYRVRVGFVVGVHHPPH